MFRNKLNCCFLLSFFVCISSNWLEECPDRRKSLGRCLAGLCPFEAECINDHCCEFPKLPSIKPTSNESISPEGNVTSFSKKGRVIVPLLPLKKSSPESEEDNKPLTSEEVKLAATTTTATTTVVTRKSKTKKIPSTKATTIPATTTTTTLEPEIASSTEDPVCNDGSYSIGECMDDYCPEGYACENGYCCKCRNWPCGKVILTTPKPINLHLTSPSDSFEISNESSSSEETQEIISTSTITVEEEVTTTSIPKTSTKKPKKKHSRKFSTTQMPINISTTSMNKSNIIGSASSSSSTTLPSTTIATSTTTEEDYSTKDVCLEGYPIGECVDGKCPEKHECIQNYCCEITPAINCSDLLRSCKKALCNKAQYLNFMTEQCGRTCRRCDQQNSQGITQPKRPRRCRDSRNDCIEWAAEGFCKSALYSLEQKRHLCGKSCKLC